MVEAKEKKRRDGVEKGGRERGKEKESD